MTEGSTEAPRWPGVEIPAGVTEQGMYTMGFPRNLGGPAASARDPERGVTGNEIPWPATVALGRRRERKP
jgi:hypothetical protein